MLSLQIVAANLALVVAWCGALAILGFRPIPMQLVLLLLGLVTSSTLVTRALLERARDHDSHRRSDKRPRLRPE